MWRIHIFCLVFYSLYCCCNVKRSGIETIYKDSSSGLVPRPTGTPLESGVPSTCWYPLSHLRNTKNELIGSAYISCVFSCCQGGGEVQDPGQPQVPEQEARLEAEDTAGRKVSYLPDTRTIVGEYAGYLKGNFNLKKKPWIENYFV